MRIVWAFLKVNFQIMNEYRGDLLVYMLTNSLSPLLALTMWRVASQSGNLIFTEKEIVAYFLLATWTHLFTTAWHAYFIGYDIQTGEFSKNLLKPFSLFLFTATNNLTEKIYKMTFSTTMIAILSFFILGNVTLISNVFNLIPAVISLFSALFINILISIILGLTYFWTNDIDFLRFLVFHLGQIFSGVLVPLAFFPDQIREAVYLLPFRYIVSFPVEILTGKLTHQEMSYGFLIQISWLIFFYLIYKLIYAKAIRHNQSFGG